MIASCKARERFGYRASIPTRLESATESRIKKPLPYVKSERPFRTGCNEH